MPSKTAALPLSSAERPFFVVTGMHRSHTSLLGRMLVDAGMKFHSELVSADGTNPHGHYEDVDFLKLQEDILDDHGAKWFRGTTKTFSLTQEQEARAATLIDERYEALGEGWGFKVPHSTLFLDYWAQFPGARFLLIFRDPAAVLSSMYRRMGGQVYYRPDAWFSMAEAYAEYNRRIARHRREYPDRTYLIDSAHLVADPKRVISAAAEKIGMPVSSDWAGSGMIDKGIKSAPSRPLEEMLTRFFSARPAVLDAYRDLKQLADSADKVGGDRAGISR